MKTNINYLSASLAGILFLFSSCEQRSKIESTTEKKDTILTIQTENIDSITAPVISLKEHPDTSLNELFLLNWSSIENTVKQGIQLTEDDKDDFSYCLLTNVSSSELVKMLHYPGSSKNEFAKFILTKNDKTKSTNVIQIGILNFETSNGTSLDTKLVDFKLKYGINDEDLTSEGAFRVFNNKIDDFKTNTFLKRFNMPAYMAKYCFENDILVKIEIGFDYP